MNLPDGKGETIEKQTQAPAASRHLPDPAYGSKITEPVVLRPSRSVWHFATSASL